MTLTDQFRSNLKAALNEDGAPSARALSLAAGGSESMVRQILTGASQSPRLETIEDLARALGRTPQSLLFGSTRPVIEERLLSAFRALPADLRLDWLERAEQALDQNPPKD